MKTTRRKFLATAGVAGLASPLASRAAGGAERTGRGQPADVEARHAKLREILRQPVLKRELFTSPVILRSVELLQWENSYLCRVRSEDGAEGLSVAHSDMRRLYPIFLRNLQPFFIGKDARELDLILEKVYIYGFNFRYNGISLGLPLATLEFAILDLLGRMAGRSLGRLTGDIRARALAAEGVELYVSARGEERLHATAREIADATGARVIPIVADHASDEGREKILAVCPDPDIVVGTCSPAPFTPDFRRIAVEDWRHHLEVGLISPVEFIRATIDGMCRRGFGGIVNISTGAAKFPAEIRSLSGPPRAALSNYTAAIAKSVARHNVTINNLLPGMHHTAATRERFGQIAAEQGKSYEEIQAQWDPEYWRALFEDEHGELELLDGAVQFSSSVR